MTRFIFILFLTGVSGTLELLLRSLGILVPFTALLTFYIVIAFGREWGTLTAVIAGCLLDFSGRGEEHPWSILILLSVVWLAGIWRRRSESDSLMLSFIPGMILPFWVWLLSLIFFAEHFWESAITLFPAVFPAAVFCSLSFPLAIWLLDIVNEKLHLPLYTEIQARRKIE